MKHHALGRGREAAEECRIYDREELDAFKAILMEALDELRADGSPLVAPDQVELTKIRLAAAIFVFADRGERDPPRLKRLAKCLLNEAVQFPTLLRLRGSSLGRQ